MAKISRRTSFYIRDIIINHIICAIIYQASSILKLINITKFLCADQSKIYVDVFTKMDRLPQLIKYYYNCQKVSLAQEWRKTIEFAQDENVIYWLRVYYDKLLSVWHDQVFLIFQVLCKTIYLWNNVNSIALMRKLIIFHWIFGFSIIKNIFFLMEILKSFRWNGAIKFFRTWR